MISTQVNIAWQIVQTLTPEELRSFAALFEKMEKPAMLRPRKKKFSFVIPPIEILAAQGLELHRKSAGRRLK